MASIVDMLTGGNEYTSYPRAHENIDKEINKNDILGVLGGIHSVTPKGMPPQIWETKDVFNEAKTPEGKSILDKILKKNKSSMKNLRGGVGAGASSLPIGILTALLGGGAIGTGLDQKFDLSGKISKWLRPDPDIGTKEQHDEDMDMIIKTMGPEAKLKYLKKTGQGYPADEEMFLRAEPQDTNEILLQLLREQELK